MANYSDEQLKGIYIKRFKIQKYVFSNNNNNMKVLKDSFEKCDTDKSGSIDRQGLFSKTKIKLY
jgi:hypothetical protein